MNITINFNKVTGESAQAPNPDWPQICDCPYRISIVPEEQMHYSMHYAVYQGFT